MCYIWLTNLNIVKQFHPFIPITIDDWYVGLLIFTCRVYSDRRHGHTRYVPVPVTIHIIRICKMTSQLVTTTAITPYACSLHITINSTGSPRYSALFLLLTGFLSSEYLISSLAWQLNFNRWIIFAFGIGMKTQFVRNRWSEFASELMCYRLRLNGRSVESK